MPSNQHRHHVGHSHSHKHDSTYLVSTNKKDAAVRITRIGLFVNLLMAISKGVGGFFLNSQSLMADAFHSLTDLVSDFLTLATVAWSLKPPTTRFPSGYGKIESLGSLGVSSLLLAGGLGLGWHSCWLLYDMCFAVDAVASATDHLHNHSHDDGHIHGWSMFSHSHSHNPADMGIPNVHAAWIAAGSILVKEFLYNRTMKIAKERKSSVLASNAVHHRIDSLTSIVALTAILGSNILDNVSWLDPVGGVLVSLMVVRAGYTNTGNALLELADVGIDSEIRGSVRNAAVKALTASAEKSSEIAAQAVEVRDVQGVKSGQNYLVDIELGVPEDWTVKQTRLVEDLVRTGVGAQVRGTRRVRVKFVPKSDEAPDFADEFIKADVGVKADVGARSGPEHEDEHEHDHDHDHVHDTKELNGNRGKKQR